MGTFVEIVERDTFVLDINTVVLLLATSHIYPIAHLALDAHICDEAVHCFRIDPRQVARVGVAVPPRAVPASVGELSEFLAAQPDGGAHPPPAYT